MAVDFFGFVAEIKAVWEIFDAFDVFGVDLADDTPPDFFFTFAVFLAIELGFGRVLGVMRDLDLGAAPDRIFPVGLAFASLPRAFFLLVASFLFAGFCFFKAFKGNS